MEYAFQSSKSWSEGLFFQVLHHKSTLLLELERASDRGDVVVGLSAVSLILAWPNAFSVLSYSNFSHGARTDFSLRTLGDPFH